MRTLLFGPIAVACAKEKDEPPYVGSYGVVVVVGGALMNLSGPMTQAGRAAAGAVMT